MASPSGSFEFTSLPKLLDELAILVAGATQPHQPWTELKTLDRLFCEKHGCAIAAAAQVCGSYDLRSLLRDSQRFSIYSTPNPQNFHIKLSSPADTGKAQAVPVSSALAPQGSPDLLKIESIPAFEAAIVKIVKVLTTADQDSTVAALGHRFSNCYGQTLKLVSQRVCPEMKLIDLLQTIPT